MKILIDGLVVSYYRIDEELTAEEIHQVRALYDQDYYIANQVLLVLRD
jgi:hypothetical protein